MVCSQETMLSCDVCGWWEHVSTGNKKVARRHVKQFGWTRRRRREGMVDLCPKCSLEESAPNGAT